AVEGVSGFDVGTVNSTGEIVRLQMKKRNADETDPDIKKVLRRATDKDIEIWQQNKDREKEATIRGRAIARQLNLDMKITEVEIQADGRKATFFYIADDRVDFRELIKVYAKEFRVKVEMRQIGARQEAAKVGGIGSCGRELCCSTWLTDFKSVNTTAARYQNLSINQSKLSGQCGRLKCCLNYELDIYLDALQHFPDNADTLQIAKGTAILIKKDIFKNLMWYTLPDSSKQYPLTIERVRKIKQLNERNQVPDELEAVDVTTQKTKEPETEFVELVGQISLRSLEKAEKKKRHGHHQQHGGQQKEKEQPRQQQQQQHRGGGGRDNRDNRDNRQGGSDRKGGGGGGDRRHNQPRNQGSGQNQNQNRDNRGDRGGNKGQEKEKGGEQ
ncbi:MAG TPA: regulatory iron-sulfur-containing complex subunit RicT, partial [Niastella sp.]|nr:regulatory iron-sulfur-containing complex subunit RicT [Niastella sp.]